MSDNPVEGGSEDTADAELEELRRAISHSMDSETPELSDDVTVIANASSYIEQLKTHIEELRQENEQLKEGATDSSSATESTATSDDQK